MRSCRNLVVVLSFMLVGSIAGFADACQTAALDTVVAQGTCTIGGLTFDFTGTDLASGYQSNGVSAADIFFTPSTGSGGTGFNLSIDGGLTSIGSATGFTSNYLRLFYGVSTTDNSPTIMNVVATGDPTAHSETDGDANWSTGYAYVEAFGCNSNGDCTYSTTYRDGFAAGPGYYGYNLTGPVADLKWYGFATLYTSGSNGGWSSISSAQILYNASQPGDGLPPDYVEGNTVLPTPEPGTLALLGSGLIGFGWRRFRK
jgi:hypothetical protein